MTLTRERLFALLASVLAVLGFTGITNITDDEGAQVCVDVELETEVPCESATTTTTDAPVSTTTTAAPTTTTTTTTPPTTTAPPTTTTEPPGLAVFYEDFATAESVGRFDIEVIHRNVDLAGFPNFSGGTWLADHADNGDGTCGGPDTTRELSWFPDQLDRTASVYWCPNGTGHLMTSMGDIDNYSWVWFTPIQSFVDVTEVRWDINGTDLGQRQFPEVKLIPADRYDPLNMPCVMLSPTPCDTDTIGTLGGIAVSDFPDAGATDEMYFGSTAPNQRCDLPIDADAEASKAIRRTNILRDLGNGTIEWEVVGQGVCTFTGSFPTGPVRVVFADHNYTPNKGCSGEVCYGYTWHWDTIEIAHRG